MLVEYLYAQLVSLLIYYETNNQEAFEYRFRSLIRRMAPVKNSYHLEIQFLNHIKKSFFAIDNSEKKVLFKEMEKTLSKELIDSEYIPNDRFFYFNIRQWVKGKISKDG